MISTSLTSHFVHLSFPWFNQIVFLCFLIYHRESLKQLFSVNWAHHRYPCLWNRSVKIIMILWRYNVLMILLHSLEFCVAGFASEVAVTSSSLYQLFSREKHLASVLRLSQAFSGYTYSMLLALLYGRILKLVCFLSVLKPIRPNAVRFPFSLQKWH